MAFWLALLFALVALAYATVGFGGGSTYNALLSLAGVEYTLIPVVALACNLVVVTGGTARFWRAGQYDARQIAPLILVSAPAAFMGGLVPLTQNVFFLLLGCALLFSAIMLVLPQKPRATHRLPPALLLGLSTIIGFVAGLSGIGGGIFLAPMLYLVGWSNAQRIAAFASLYILVNSVAGLGGQLIKNGSEMAAVAVAEYWPLLIAVLLGGQIGSMIGLKFFNEMWLRRATALLVGYVAIRLLLEAIFAI